MLRLRSPHSRRLWRAAWSGDEQRFRSKFDAASAEERRNLILEQDLTSGWSAPHFAAVYDGDGSAVGSGTISGGGDGDGEGGGDSAAAVHSKASPSRHLSICVLYEHAIRSSPEA